eukprot:scaffold258507_cov30-Tisochrysis_lutea.AAC.1
MRLGERATENGEILREDENPPPVDHPVPSDDTVSGWRLFLCVEVVGSVGLERVVLTEGARVEEELEALPRRELALVVLRGDPVLSSTKQ